MRVTFRPGAPLAGATTYTIHIGGSLRDQQNHMMGFDQHGTRMGGQWVIGGMMSGGMMSPGWYHSSGSYGMSFTFTTR